MIMSENNEILREQAKARKEFLELKRMQQSTERAEAPKREEYVAPKTLKEKWDNFIYHYKTPLIVVVVAVMMAVLTVVQIATKTRYDLEVVLYSYDHILDEQALAMEDYLEQFAPDINGDGVVNVQITNCSFDKSVKASEEQYIALNRLKAMVEGNDLAFLYITDKDSYEYFNDYYDEKSMFEGVGYTFGDDFYNAIDKGDYKNITGELIISCRRPIEKDFNMSKEKVSQAYKGAQDTLKELNNK